MIIKSFLAEQDAKVFNTKFLLIYGENIGLIEDIKKKIKFLNSKSELNISSQEDVVNNVELFYSKIFNISLFQCQKVFFINQCNDKILEILQNIENKISDQKFFLFADILDKKSKLRSFFDKSKVYGSIPCYEDNLISLTKIIQTKLKGYSGLTREIINLIIDNSTYDRSKLNNELIKIISYFEKKSLNINEVKKILNLKENEKLNELKDSAINGDKLKTNNLLNNNFQDEKNFLYINLINQRLYKLKDIIYLSKKHNLQEAISLVKPPLFWKDKPIISEQLKKWNEKKIKIALKETYNLEINLKSKTALSKKIIVKKLIVDICNLANAA